MVSPPRSDELDELGPPAFGLTRRRAGRRAVAVAQRRDWREWFGWFRREWKQGEHLSIIGPTGTGKTTLEIALLTVREYVVFIVTKPADDVIERLEERGYVRVTAFPRQPPDDVKRYLLWPPGAGSFAPESKAKQRAVIHDALRRTFEGPRGELPGRWCVCIDEARVVADPRRLGLGEDVNQMLLQGRSIKLSMVLGFQRPSWVPQEAYDQPSHLFIAQDNDRRNLRRFQEIGGVDGERVAATIARLDRFEWAHVDARPGRGEVNVIRLPRNLAT